MVRAARSGRGASDRGVFAMILRFVIGALVGLLGLLGLFLAAGSHDGLYQAGLIFALFCVLFIFWLIKRSYDEADRERQADH
ncbi:hypothetical protein AY599_09240 [Leptolyngbya valderiana BDU 20041]|nr:hypothetical protein AY599_09240 [Leptolyngbya valderiana BDU 20041]